MADVETTPRVRSAFHFFYPLSKTIVRRSLILFGGLAPLFFEVAQFRHLVFQLLGQTSTQLVLTQYSNPGLLHHDIILRLHAKDVFYPIREESHSSCVTPEPATGLVNTLQHKSSQTRWIFQEQLAHTFTKALCDSTGLQRCCVSQFFLTSSFLTAWQLERRQPCHASGPCYPSTENVSHRNGSAAPFVFVRIVYSNVLLTTEKTVPSKPDLPILPERFFRLSNTVYRSPALKAAATARLSKSFQHLCVPRTLESSHQEVESPITILSVIPCAEVTECASSDSICSTFYSVYNAAIVCWLCAAVDGRKLHFRSSVVGQQDTSTARSGVDDAAFVDHRMPVITFTARLPENLISTSLAFRLVVVLCLLLRWFWAETRILAEAFFVPTEEQDYCFFFNRQYYSTLLSLISAKLLRWICCFQNLVWAHHGRTETNAQHYDVVASYPFQRSSHVSMGNSANLHYHQDSIRSHTFVTRNALGRTLIFCAEYLRSLATIIFLHVLSHDAQPIVVWTPVGSLSPHHLVTLQCLAWIAYIGAIHRATFTVKHFSEWRVYGVYWGALYLLLFTINYVCVGYTSVIALTFMYYSRKRMWIKITFLHVATLFLEASIRSFFKLEQQITSHDTRRFYYLLREQGNNQTVETCSTYPGTFPEARTSNNAFLVESAAGHIVSSTERRNQDVLAGILEPGDLDSVVELPFFRTASSSSSNSLDSRLNRGGSENRVVQFTTRLLPQFPISLHHWVFPADSSYHRPQQSSLPYLVQPLAQKTVGTLNDGNASIKQSLAYLVERTGLHLYRVLILIVNGALYIPRDTMAAGSEENEQTCVTDMEKRLLTSKIVRLGDHQPLCYVCMSRVDNAVMLPCMHGGVCLRCGHAVLSSSSLRNRCPRCPLCRRQVRALGQLYETSFPNKSSASLSPPRDHSGIASSILDIMCHLKCQKKCLIAVKK